MRIILFFISVGSAVFGLISTGLNLWLIVDISSILIVIIPTFSSAFIVGGKETLTILTAGWFGKEYKNANGSLVFSVMGDVAFGSGLFGAIIGFIKVFSESSNIDFKIIANPFAMSLVTIGYGLVIKYYLCIPGELVLRRQESNSL